VKTQEHICALKRYAFVSINEWMILSDSKCICGRKPMYVRFWVKLVKPFGARQSGVEQTGIPEAPSTAESSEELPMDF